LPQLCWRSAAKEGWWSDSIAIVPLWRDLEVCQAPTEVTRDYECSTIPVAGTYAFDPAHPSVAFHVRHMMVAKVRGRFAAPTGTFTIAEDPLLSSVEVSIDAATVDTG
jgi:polyisoprenoid-binding protein YceI